MSPLNTIAVLIGLAALFAYVNERFIRLPSTIGLMALALSAVVLVPGAGVIGGSGRGLGARPARAGSAVIDPLQRLPQRRAGHPGYIQRAAERSAASCLRQAGG
jgi:hypothetical protein